MGKSANVFGCVVMVAAMLIGLGACRPDMSDRSDVLVGLNKMLLTRGEVASVIPKGTPEADSLLMAEDYIKKWVKNQLVYEVAKRNIGEQSPDIQQLVEEYRRALIMHRYQESLIRNKLSGEIQDRDRLAFYEDNPQKFQLEKAIIKGLFLKVPLNTPGLDDVQKKYKSNNPNAIEEIEKYGMRNAVVYEYFYDRWVDFDEMLARIPVRISDQEHYLKNNRVVETADSVYCYLLNISEYIPAGQTAPYEYVVPQIQEMIINKRKVDFLREFEEDLYRNAIRKGEVVYFTEQKKE
ncbi:MAG: peptidyl-prolyl cis-trans isomerase [Tannerella sp.]|jgi:hypothetical protein|nr:peptidyl-prolyl cis-trans isomerase [Tannerella sp.]